MLVINNLLKRLFDILLSIFGIIITFPILIIIAISIKLTSPGPILYLGNRTGLNGKAFKIFKFRSMHIGSEKGPGTTSKNDHRITKIGFSIRKYKLDELPQLFNILFGDMSFVGPRPELKRYTDLYKGEEKIILSVKPGLTDFSSLYFFNLNELIDNNNPDYVFEKKILYKKNRLRIAYVKQQNFWLDILLIIKTFLKLIRLK